MVQHEESIRGPSSTGTGEARHEAEVVVIGGGVRGTAIAYYLARDGRDVLLLERSGLSAGATGRNVGMVNASGKGPAHYAELSLASCALFPDLQYELGPHVDIEYERNGNLTVYETERDLLLGRDYVRQQNAVPGLKIEMLTAREAQELEPALSPSIAGASFCATDGQVSPARLCLAFAAAAARLGARIWTGAEARNILTQHGRVTGVETSRGCVHAPNVVVAAGVNVAPLSQLVGLAVLVVPSFGQVIVTEVIPRLVRRVVTGVIPTRRGNVLISGVEIFTGMVEQVDRQVAVRQVRRALRLFPALATARACRIFPALKPWPVDGIPVLGESALVRGFYVATGHSGVTLAPVTGRLMAELLRGAPSIELGPYAMERFGRGNYRFSMESFRRFQSHWFGGDGSAGEPAHADEDTAGRMVVQGPLSMAM